MYNNIRLMIIFKLISYHRKTFLCIFWLILMYSNVFIFARFEPRSIRGIDGKFIVDGNTVSSVLSSFVLSSRVVRYFRSNSSNISRGCLFIRHEKFSPLPLQAIRFNLVRVDSIRRVVWLNSFRNKSAERGRGRNTSDKPSKSLKRGNSRAHLGPSLFECFGIGLSPSI